MHFHFFLFHKDGPNHHVLHIILGVYSCYRPDVGYVQGMSFIEPVSILNLEETVAFIVFVSFMNKLCRWPFSVQITARY